jgi:hypothetical protein
MTLTIDPGAVERAVQLTGKGIAYAEQHLPTSRKAIEDQIEALIARLDDMEPDPDLEPEMAGWDGNTDDREGDDEREGDKSDDEPTLGWERGGHPYDQTSIGVWGLDECEDVSEDEGADIQAQPHDDRDSGDDEPFLGWSEYQATSGALPTGDEWPRGSGSALFDGSGYRVGQHLARRVRGARHVPVSPAIPLLDPAKLRKIAPDSREMTDFRGYRP